MDKLFKISIWSSFTYALFYICVGTDCVDFTWGMVYIYIYICMRSLLKYEFAYDEFDHTG